MIQTMLRESSRSTPRPPKKPGIVGCDICNDARLRKVFRTMRDFGDHLQYSVFKCQFNAIDVARCRDALAKIIHHGEDQVLFIEPRRFRSRQFLSLELIDVPQHFGDGGVLLDRCFASMHARLKQYVVSKKDCNTNRHELEPGLTSSIR